MSIEKNLERIADALEKIAAGNTTTISTTAKAEPAKAAAPAKAAPAAKAEPAKAAAPAKGAKPSVSLEQMKTALIEVKEKFGMPEAKAILAEHGYDAMANVKAEDAKAVYESAKQKLLADVADEEPADDGL